MTAFYSSGLRGSQKSYSKLQHMCDLDIDLPIQNSRMTCMIGTIGPACDSVETLKQLMEEGMNVCRLNIAYRNHQYFSDAIKRIREAEAQLKVAQQIAIGIDITGPGIRLGKLKQESGLNQELKLVRGERLKFTSHESYKDIGDSEIVYANFSKVMDQIAIGSLVYIEDGPLCFKVVEKGSDWLLCEVEEAGELGGNMLFTVPRLLPGIPSLTDKDKEDIKFILQHENDVDIVFASWVWSPELVHEIRKELGEKSDAIKVIAKIENYEGVKRFGEILEVADAVMVARGNLGIDIPPQKVFLAQKTMIGMANKAGKAVICATQMLASMIQNPRPTRAEATDVANAILDGADAVMLSRETARGKHPVKAMHILSAVCKEAESTVFSQQLMRDLTISVGLTERLDTTHTTAIAATEAAVKCQAKAIVVITSTGRSARLIAKYRPRCLIIAISRNTHTARFLHFHRGILPVLYEGTKDVEWIDDVDERIHNGLCVARDSGHLKPGDIVVLVTGWTAGAGYTNTVRIITCPDFESQPQPFVRIPSDSISNEFV